MKKRSSENQKGTGWLVKKFIYRLDRQILDQALDHGSWIMDQIQSGCLQADELINSPLLFRIFDLKQADGSESEKMQAELVRDCICLRDRDPWFPVGGTSLSCPEVGLMTTEARATMILVAKLEMQRNIAPDVGVLAIIGAVHTEAAKVALVFVSCHTALLPQVSVRVFNEEHSWLSCADDVEHRYDNAVGCGDVTVAEGFSWGVLCAWRTCPDDVKEA